MEQRLDARAVAIAEIAAALEDAGSDDSVRLAEAVFETLQPTHHGWWTRSAQRFTAPWSGDPLGSDAEPLFSFTRKPRSHRLRASA